MPPITSVDGDIARPVPGYPDYRVYTTGDVYSVKGGKFLKIGFHTGGYPIIHIRKDGKKKTLKCHRLVALAFIPNPEGLPCVDHIDNNRENNDVKNLRWASYATNARNSSVSKRNTSGHQGVCYYSQKHTWLARWTDDAGKERCKSCASKDEAIAYRAARVAEFYDRV